MMKLQCKPLHCELCGCNATSPIQAKMHYEGKTHDKNVRLFFQNWDGNTDGTVPQKLFTGEKKPRPANVPSSQLHCSTCDIYFTSHIQLEQHMQGKNHSKKVSAEDKSQFYQDSEEVRKYMFYIHFLNTRVPPFWHTC